MNIWGTGNEQHAFHIFVLILVLICVPIMLIPKPIILYCRLKDGCKKILEPNNNNFKPFLEEGGVRLIPLM